jgi:hypothetical protein
MYKISLRRAVRVGTLAAAVATSVAISGPAWASDTYNHAAVTIRGGNGQALASCVNLARTLAQHHRQSQSNYCDNFAEADGGSVTLRHVSIFIDQEGGGGHHSRTENSATVTIVGGSSHAVASCLNYLQGTATADQTNECSNTAVAPAGDVHLSNVDITVVQTG